jgi:FkbM family methyltransferase
MKQEIEQVVKATIAGRLRSLGGAVSRLTNDLVLRDGVWMDLSSPSIGNATRAEIFFRFYESSERRAIDRYLPRGMPCVELGSSIGYVSNLIARKSGYSPQVCVEANPSLLPVLKRNLLLNRCDHVKVLHGAIAYSGGESVRFSLADDHLSGHVAFLGGESQRSVEVPRFTLRRVLDEVSFSRYALIADIEGAEVEMIESEEDFVMQGCEWAILELHPYRMNSKQYSRTEIALMLGERWKMYQVHTDGKVWVFNRSVRAG